MRNFFTQLFLIVLMVTLFGTSGYAVVPPYTLWPADNSTRVLLPSVVQPGQIFTITFPGTNPSNTVKRLGNQGIISLNRGMGGTGILRLPFQGLTQVTQSNG